jgi:hypothetical protein
VACKVSALPISLQYDARIAGLKRASTSLVVACSGVSDTFKVAVTLVSPSGINRVQNHTVTPDKLPYQVFFGTTGELQQNLTLHPDTATQTIPLSIIVQPGLFVRAGDYKDRLQFNVLYPADQANSTPPPGGAASAQWKRRTPAQSVAGRRIVR